MKEKRLGYCCFSDVGVTFVGNKRNKGVTVFKDAWSAVQSSLFFDEVNRCIENEANKYQIELVIK